MTSPVTLLLTCMLFSKGLSLTCNQCLPTSGKCTTSQITCQKQCLTSNSTVNIKGTSTTVYKFRTCGVPGQCVNGTMNLGTMLMTVNAKCCTNDLCNNFIPPGFPQGTLNGKVCYTCDTDSCSAKVDCSGTEDLCITASVQQGNNIMSMKGCVSKSLCVASGSTNITGFNISNIQCCEGNLCNAAESFTLSFLLMIVPLLSSIFY